MFTFGARWLLGNVVLVFVDTSIAKEAGFALSFMTDMHGSALVVILELEAMSPLNCEQKFYLVSLL